MSVSEEVNRLVTLIGELPEGKNLVYCETSTDKQVPSHLRLVVDNFVNNGIVSRHMRRLDATTMQYLVQKLKKKKG